MSTWDDNEYPYNSIWFDLQIESSSEIEDLRTFVRDNLAVDSITIAEVVFQLEDIFEIKIENQDLVEIRTIDELNSYIIGKLA